MNWYVSVGIETEGLTDEAVGIDLGLKDLAVCSNTETSYKNINKTKQVRKLEKNIRKLYKRFDNIRTDYRHKVSTEIVKTKPSQIVMENLNVSGMMKNRHLSKSIANQGFYEFKQMIRCKCVKI